MKSTGHQTSSGRYRGKTFLLNALIVGLSLLVLYLLYGLLSRVFVHPPVEAEKAGLKKKEVIQMDVLNGSGAPGVATKFTDYLRARGYDVVEMGNYKSFDVQHSMVIDRTGDLETAKRVAYALGINEKYVMQQIAADYYLDVSVVIGADHGELNPMK